MSFTDVTVVAQDGKTILHGVSGDVGHRAFMLLGGPSGAGKTVFLNALTGRSRLRVRGTLPFAPDEYVYVRTHPEYHARSVSVREEVRFSAEMYARKSIDAGVIDAILESLGLPDAPISTLSTGQRKRLGVACALTKPSIRCLVLDEPTSNLDSSAAVAVLEAIRNTIRRMENVSVICSIHQPSALMLSFFDTALLLCNGHGIYFGPMGAPMYNALSPLIPDCEDYDTVQFALSQPVAETGSFFSRWAADQSIALAGQTPTKSVRQIVFKYTRSIQSVRLSSLLKFESDPRLISMFRVRTLMMRMMRLSVVDWRREIARIVLISVGWMICAWINGRPTFEQSEVLTVVGVIRSFTYFQGMTGVSRAINTHESDQVAADAVGNGMYAKWMHDLGLFMTTSVAAGLMALFAGVLLCWWLEADFTAEIWASYALYFIYVDYIYSLSVRLTKSIAVSSISALTVILICATSPMDTYLIATSELYRYLQSAIMGHIEWEACRLGGLCYGGSDGCSVLHLVTFSECGQSVTSTLLSSMIWVVILSVGMFFIDIRL
jgi:ABC-type multidrug transport system ATPase subunit